MKRTLCLFLMVLMIFTISNQNASLAVSSKVVSQPVSYIDMSLSDNKYSYLEALKEKSLPDSSNNPPELMLPAIDITLSFAGDCTLGSDPAFSYYGSFLHRLELQKNNYSYFFEKVRRIFEEDNLSIVNLETTLTNAQIPANKRFRFKGDPLNVNILKQGSIEAVNISNNHIHDFMDDGFKDTLRNLKSGRIIYFGEGNIAYCQINNKVIALIGYTGWDTKAKKTIYDDLTRAGKNADLVVVSFHWGDEHKYYPNTVQTELAHFCVDNGADIVVGHHPHVIQGIETYKNRYIAYSLGNFCFGGNKNPQDKDCMIFQVKVTFKGEDLEKTSCNIIPCRVSSSTAINDYQPIILTGAESQKLIDRIYEYSSKLRFGIKPEI